MIRRYSFGLAFLFVVLGCTVSAPVAFAQPADGPLVKVGMARSFFNDLLPVHVSITEDMFSDVMKTATGLNGKLYGNDDALAVGQKLNDGAMQLGVFHGHEFAWVQKNYPKITPLMLTLNKYREVKVFIIVHQTNPATKIGDLAGKTMDVPLGTKQHTMMYLEKHCTDNAKPDWKNFFGKVQRSKSVIEAINEVARGNTTAVVVDTITLETYKAARGPVFDKQLKILAASETFPPPVIAYKADGVDQAVLKKVTDGLLNAHKIRDCAAMLAMWQIEVFEPVSADYSQQLANSIKLYPLPVVTKVGMR